MGSAPWEVVRKIVVPYTRVGVVGGVMLALAGRLAKPWR